LIEKLVEIVAKLRSPEGCSWDRKQTHASLVPCLMEEAWEVADDIFNGKITDPLKEELGDLLLQVVFHSQIATEENRFQMQDVIDAVSAKMVERHPHVFGEGSKNLNDGELHGQWHRIKAEKKNHKSVLDDISHSLPALLSAQKIGKRAASLGFEWETPWDVLRKVEEELEETREGMADNDHEAIEEELGDLLFTITNLARHYKIDSEIALKKASEKFRTRFSLIEDALKEAKSKNKPLKSDEMEEIWKQAKAKILNEKG